MDEKIKKEAEDDTRNKSRSSASKSKKRSRSSGSKGKKRSQNTKATTSKRIKKETEESNVNKEDKVNKEDNVNKESKVNKESNVKKEDNTQNVFVVGVNNHAQLMFSHMAKWEEIEYNEAISKKCPMFADVILITEFNRRFAAHSYILRAGSEGLKKTLEDERKMSTSYPLEIKLKNVSGTELEWMLSYLYDGQATLPSYEHHVRMIELVHRYKLITNRGQEAIDNEAQEARTKSFFEELRKGGVVKIGKGAKCLDCGQEFSQFSSAKTHFNLKHAVFEDPSELTCHLCQKEHKRRFYLERHLAQVHNIKKRDILSRKNRDKSD